ncbi:MAG TPA: hypothetical protein VKG25_17115 [Bryobacteraceae bacterium]|nr:hypothetical protein [Bryobacteraceae bacterium]
MPNACVFPSGPSAILRPGWSNFTFCFHDGEEVGRAALAKIGMDTGLRPEGL